MAATEAAPHFSMNEMSAFRAEDFETASIRSAAPSYISEAPSYHSQATTNNEPIPPYSPPAPSSSSSGAAQHTRTSSSAAATLLLPTSYDFAPSPGLPPIPPPAPRRPELPSLGGFRIPSWSTVTSNPTARHYHNVASRRVNQTKHLEGIKRMVLERVEEEERNRVRPLEDPYLVGEEAASRARRERLARENGDEILYREDRRWDFFLGQMKDWDERERDRGWKAPFRREAETATRGRLARRITGRS
ncbi:hypothetical protein UCRPA7_4869 [Phaeoacremonium minimum UCRPA7]|uniref:Uncharacterized protein n=1 Tax=Phaeoacremonium minimum (strain UCR-PA7) TaxID=1286976 RepID=R8BJW3_PHAM7|nr:hypothetical protein UCRPA7_4869 [Phaeoacremonium minimum UCRPA7]EON99569.1 hypothetical protein UCRPA7_4869 [Phaeoacremonium minimum UCRPA7]